MTQRDSESRETQASSHASEDPEGQFRVVDKRQFLNPESDSDDQQVIEEPRYPTFVEELRARLAETERQFEEKKKQMSDEIEKTKSRLSAEFERRVAKEKQEALLPFLEILDNLERALDVAKNDSSKGLVEGIEMTANLFRATLQQHEIESIAVLDQPFDPNLATAVGIVEVEDTSRDGIVLEEVQRGYLMGSQLMRAAQVRVGKLV